MITINLRHAYNDDCNIYYAVAMDFIATAKTATTRGGGVYINFFFQNSRRIFSYTSTDRYLETRTVSRSSLIHMHIEVPTYISHQPLVAFVHISHGATTIYA